MTENKNNLGGTIPLYDEVKRTIYINFNEMSYAYSDVMTSYNKSNYKIAMIDFRKRFIKFFIQVNHDNKLNKLNTEQKNKIIKYYKNLYNIKRKDCFEIMEISRTLLEQLGITKIEGRIGDSWAI